MGHMIWTPGGIYYNFYWGVTYDSYVDYFMFPISFVADSIY